MGCSSSSDGAGSAPSKKGGKVEIGYLDFRGGSRGNPTRYIANYCGVNYVEKSYTGGTDQFAKVKGSIMEFGNLPYIIDGDVKLSETMGIMGYIAGKWKPEVCGRTPQKKAECYRMQCICADKFFAFMKLAFA